MILLTYGRDLFELNESVLKPIQYVPLLAITVINSLLLVFRLGDKAQLHTSLRIQFQKLAVYLKNLEIKGELSSDAIAEGNQRRAEIEVDEPKTLRVLDTRCHNETNQALGYKHNYFHLTKWQTFWSKYWDVGTLSNEPYDIPG